MTKKHLRTAYLGPEGTFSYFTARAWLPEPELVPFSNFHSLFRAVAEGDCACGLAPLENSLRGSIGENFDLFMRHDVNIRAEAFSRINNCLLSREKKFEDIKTVYSHAQPLAQCAEWLERALPWARLAPASSTAAAAKAAEAGASAAIGHRLLSSMAGLEVLAENIEDESCNWTRFVLIAMEGTDVSVMATRPGNVWKSSFIFTVDDKPGALASVLRVLERGGINMRKLESRPLRGLRAWSDGWKYAFFTDVEADLACTEQARALEELRLSCGSLRFLGSYPQGPELL